MSWLSNPGEYLKGIEIMVAACDHSVISADVRLSVGPEYKRRLSGTMRLSISLRFILFALNENHTGSYDQILAERAMHPATSGGEQLAKVNRDSRPTVTAYAPGFGNPPSPRNVALIL
jgi:hypothetical protein